MAQKLLRRGQRVYAADGTYIGRLLQCDARFMVIGRARWKPDHWIVPNEEVGAATREVVILRGLPDAIRAETAVPWAPRPDPVGNANGVDLEPLRAGMAEIEDARIGTDAATPGEPVEAEPPARADPPLPSADDARGLERARLARSDAQVDQAIAAEIEDLEIDAACAAPPGFEPAARYDLAFEANPARPPARWPVVTYRRLARAPVPERAAAVAGTGGSGVGRDAARDPAVLERVLRDVGFSPSEAAAIASGGLGALAALHREPGQGESR